MELIIGIGTAFWIGILTSISPCPLATNIVAISFISKKVNNTKAILLTGFLYTLGRVLTYILLSFLIAKSIYSIPSLSFFLQTQIHKILGPLLIVVGMFLLELVTLKIPSFADFLKLQNIFKNVGPWGAFPLGIIFALSFCPVSAALYFGSLIPLTIKLSSSLLLSSMYGIGTGLPVFILALMLALGVGWFSRVFEIVKKFEHYLRMATGAVFICVGIYLCLVFIFGVLQ